MSETLAQLASSLELAAERTAEETRKVVSKGSLNIKTQWRTALLHRPHTPRLYTTIGYDMLSAGGLIWSDIGPDVDMSYAGGPLGGIIEYGTINNAPYPAGAISLAAEGPRFENALGDMGERLLDG